jgi:hypothetical protein
MNVKMVDKNHTCLFHYNQSIHMHTKQLIKPKLHNQHKAFYYNYKNVRSLKRWTLNMRQFVVNGSCSTLHVKLEFMNLAIGLAFWHFQSKGVHGSCKIFFTNYVE